tara:strand:- start:209 stop:631 length:423 start_codon:yes stop_codon:yes gene_type:complete
MKTVEKNNRTDFVIAGGFLLLGVYLMVSGARLPSGAGFFPLMLGVTTSLLSVGLMAQSFRTSTEFSLQAGSLKTLLGVVSLFFVYLLLWGSGWFAVRTFVFLAILLRLLRASWRTGITVSSVLTTVVTLAFKYGLHVSLE